MTILVDTSVWADFFNGFPSAESEALARFIEREDEIVTCGLVLAEFFQGIRTRRHLPRLLMFFREMRLLRPREPDSYLDAARLYRDLRHRGVTVRSTIDCLIVTLAGESGCGLLARDRDIAAILESGLSPVSSPVG